MKYIVYLTTNKINNKIYVGVHKTDNPDIFDGYLGCGINRFKKSSIVQKSNYFHNAVYKYGFDSFTRVTLKIFDSEQDALDFESLIVDKDFINRDDTYNMTEGGGLPPNLSKDIYQYDLNGNFVKAWQSLTEVGNLYKVSPSTIGSAAKNKTSSLNHFWSFEKLIKLDLSLYKAYTPNQEVFVYDLSGKLIQHFVSMGTCCKGLGINLSHLQRALNLGYQIKNKYFSLIRYEKFPIKSKVKKDSSQINQYDIDGNYIQSFISKSDAELKLNLNLGKVRDYIKQGLSYRGFLWTSGTPDLKIQGISSQSKAKVIKQYTMDGKYIKTFKTVREARKEFPNVSKVLSGKANHCHNFIFKYE